jgi:hypothetical protein
MEASLKASIEVNAEASPLWAQVLPYALQSAIKVVESWPPSQIQPVPLRRMWL